MNMKIALAAAALTAMPAITSAMPVPIDNGQTTNVTQDAVYGIDLTGEDAGFQHSFTLSGANNAVIQIDITGLGNFADVIARWFIGGTETGSATPDSNGDFSIGTTLTQDVPNQDLQISYDIAAVPLPAGLLLLGTALAGLGMTRRKTAA